MSIFYTISEEIVKDCFDVKIENLDASNDHWGNSKYIIRLADALELILYNKPEFEMVASDLIKYWLGIIKDNPRIQEIQVYADKKEPNKLFCLLVSEMNSFKPENLLKRTITFNFKKQNKTVAFNEVTVSEFAKIKATNSLLPDNWQLNEALTNKLAKYKELFL